MTSTDRFNETNVNWSNWISQIFKQTTITKLSVTLLMQHTSIPKGYVVNQNTQPRMILPAPQVAALQLLKLNYKELNE